MLISQVAQGYIIIFPEDVHPELKIRIQKTMNTLSSHRRSHEAKDDAHCSASLI